MAGLAPTRETAPEFVAVAGVKIGLRVCFALDMASSLRALAYGLRNLMIGSSAEDGSYALEDTLN